ncbi:hypothetical protein ASPBRDRAFT_38225 [Aspergillus brasiliensis CBS 101740]|uniref:Hydrophobin n=1 Tax=Aspergillus brasiliensis (strain CBS 101740 / IMI 381727 / IBT 21946) TaxID=767769 RepID=A0A1L9UW27_ASPBC|nr:hypothetical protein ASPBRDRAFT_38225 [Aspergillus brasiliensis CBS 101740]
MHALSITSAAVCLTANIGLSIALPQIGGDTCNSGSLQCCSSLQSSLSDNSGTSITGLVPVNLQGLTGMIGLGCTPIGVLGAGQAPCNAQTACCAGDTYGTLTLACNPLDPNV